MSAIKVKPDIRANDYHSPVAGFARAPQNLFD